MTLDEEVDSLEVLFSEIEDPRREHSKQYPLKEIFFLTLVGGICGVNTWRKLEIFGEEKLDFLREYLSFSNLIPSYQTMSRVFSLVKPASFERGFSDVISSLRNNADSEIIALDGKTLRGSRTSERPPLHIVNAWAVRNGLCLGQVAVDEKSNEKTAIPKILSMLDIARSTVTIDAMGCEREIAKKIVEGKADYVLAVKGNQETLLATISDHFEKLTLPQIGSDLFFETVDKGHGRIETRRYYTVAAGGCFPVGSKWPNLLSIGMVISDVFRGKTPTSECRFFIMSFAPDVKRFAECVRGHWGIENKLHWVLDVVFNEDASRVRKDWAPRNYSAVRKLALNLLRLDQGKKQGLSTKQMRAIINPTYLRELLSLGGFR